MTTLSIHIQYPLDCWYELSPVSSSSGKISGRIVVDNTETFKRAEYSRVVRGRLRIVERDDSREAGPSTSSCRGSGGMNGTLPRYVVLKIVRAVFHGHSLKREAENYELAKELQGVVIPRAYGLFHGATPDGFVTCLMLECVGDPPHDRFASAPTDFNLLTLEKLIRLHDAGFIHGCVREEHILSPGHRYSPFSASYPPCNDGEHADGGPLLISLSSLRPHRCTRTLPIVEATLRPAIQVFGCDELWAAATQMGIWNPGEIAYFSEAIPLSYARTPEQLARAAPLRMQATAAGWAEALRQARAAITAFRARYTVEDFEEEYDYEGGFEGSESESQGITVTA